MTRSRDNDPEASETAMPAPPDPDDAAATATPPGGGGYQVDGGSAIDDRPELLVGAAFVGGFALAQIVKRFGR